MGGGRRFDRKERVKVMSSLDFAVEIEPERLSTGETIYVASCTELDIPSQGATVEEARQNLVEALTLWLETASPHEIGEALSS